VNPAQFGKLYVQHEKNERAMVRAINRWQKTRDQLRRADRTLAKETGEQYPDAGDVRDLGTPEQHARARKLGVAKRKR
jgi:hypothetical protein